MKEHPSKWGNDDFEQISWHDNDIHGIRLRNPYENYDFDLILDIDHILDWIPTGPNFRYVVSPALLTFQGVSKLKVNFELEYKQKMTILDIDREEAVSRVVKGTVFREWRFRIHLIPMQQDAIVFHAVGFTQQLTAPPAGREHYWLEEEER